MIKYDPETDQEKIAELPNAVMPDDWGRPAFFNDSTTTDHGGSWVDGVLAGKFIRPDGSGRWIDQEGFEWDLCKVYPKEPTAKPAHVHLGGRTFAVTLPLPDNRLGQNSRVHWKAKAEAVSMHRNVAKYATISAMRDLVRPGYRFEPYAKGEVVWLLYVFHFPTKRKRDEANMIERCKPYIDGVVDAGLIPGDDAAVLRVAGVDIQGPAPEALNALCFPKGYVVLKFGTERFFQDS